MNPRKLYEFMEGFRKRDALALVGLIVGTYALLFAAVAGIILAALKITGVW